MVASSLISSSRGCYLIARERLLYPSPLLTMKCLSAFVSLAVLFSSVNAATLSSRASSDVTVTSSAGTCSGNLTKFDFFGVNESGAEFGSGVIPGALGTDYIFPDTRYAKPFFCA